jgi:hypothetical protein
MGGNALRQLCPHQTSLEQCGVALVRQQLSQRPAR